MLLRRKIMWSVAALFVLCGVIQIATNAAQTTRSGRVEGSVHDNLGAVIGLAHVLIRADGAARQGDSPKDITIRSDSQGRFALDVLAGFHDVCVMSDAFDPVCRKILVRRGEVTQAKFVLQPNAEVLKQIGERF